MGLVKLIKDKGINPNNSITLEEARKVRAIYEASYNEMNRMISKTLTTNLSSEHWRIMKIAELRRLINELDYVISQTEKQATKQVDKGTLQMFGEGARRMDNDIANLGIQTDFTVPSFSINRKQVEAIARQTNGYLLSKHGIILQSVNNQYINIVNTVTSMMATGTITRTQAITKILQQQSVGAKFIDKRGRTIRMDAYADMVVRTGFVQANLAGSLSRMEDYGLSQVIVSYHPGSCGLCSPWERKILDVVN
jgi:sulfur relay (sulfurtransferase) DsrC/TusE family protein